MAVAELRAGRPGQMGGTWQRLRKRIKESRTVGLYILPAGVVMIIITMLPQMYQIWMSFTDSRVKNLRFIV